MIHHAPGTPMGHMGMVGTPMGSMGSPQVMFGQGSPYQAYQGQSVSHAPHRPAQYGQPQPAQAVQSYLHSPMMSQHRNIAPSGQLSSSAQSMSIQGSPVADGARNIQPAVASRVGATGNLTREQALQKRVEELEALLERKNAEIKDMQSTLTKAGLKLPPSAEKRASLRKNMGASNGFRKVAESQPLVAYQAVDPDDPIDLRLEEFYNTTGSAIQFKRINRGFYRFGDTILELDIINHKLMARTEDGWNRNKFGPIEKFLMYYENIERERACIALEH
eukprot:TRINITY_DN27194_c0_g1_i2.p1 TRINITY_DN27194_c0_g1~~TRINITY_DN27194_c0_g1_i2.p1  ORF type:complete len:277 (+),score=25.55 TRINITY_DN27194_c0_g1_i2:95-925(+)